MTDLDEALRTERLALVDLLQTLTPPEWAAPSLCTGWRVQDVAAHLAWAPVTPPLTITVGMLRKGLRVNRYVRDIAVTWSRRGTDAILDQLRDNAARGARPFGVPRPAPLADALVHSLDITRPLRRPRTRPIDPDALRTVAAFALGTRGPANALIGGSPHKRVRGLRLVADDLEWSHGEGPEVHGSAETLLLVLFGRPVDPDELTGPGVSTLRDRL